MDSLYDAPRHPPPPFSRETLAAVPVVPEISVLCASNGPRNAFIPYNQWKQRQDAVPRNFFDANKENVQNNSILKKQVRFESPVLEQKSFECKKPGFNESVDKPYNTTHLNEKQPLTFEQMYMANIPSRQLDLSIIDLPKKSTCDTIEKPSTDKEETEERKAPKTYKEFIESNKKNNIILNDSVTDIFNYKASTLHQESPNHLSNFTVKHSENACDNKVNQHFPKPFTNKHSDPMKHQSIKPSILIDSINKPLESPQLFSNVNSDKPGYDEFQRTKPMLNLIYTNTDLNSAINTHKSSETSPYKPGSKEVQTNFAKPSTLCDCHSEASSGIRKHDSKALQLKANDDDDFSTKDLLKIIAQQSQQIAQQNSQLLLLQQQVSELVFMHKNQVPIQNGIQRAQNLHCCQNGRVHNSNNDACLFTKTNQVSLSEQGCTMGTVQNKCITSSQHEVASEAERKFLSTQKKHKSHLPNFSIGLTTSFEVSFKRPYRNPNEFLQKNSCNAIEDPSDSPKIQEVTETGEFCSKTIDKLFRNGNKDTLVDESMVFREPIKVVEPCPSPEPSININMNDFDESDSDENSCAEESFYKNLMTQVNKILQTAQIETTEKVACNLKNPNLTNKTMHKVKEATLKHLKKIGVDLPIYEESIENSSLSDETGGKSYNQEDISFAVKQLLMKYLPAEHLAKLAAKESRELEQVPLTPNDKIGTIKNRPDFSFATVQYMKKYNLIASNQKDLKQSQRPDPCQFPKILDISKLKQQPKLL